MNCLNGARMQVIRLAVDALGPCKGVAASPVLQKAARESLSASNSADYLVVCVSSFNLCCK